MPARFKYPPAHRLSGVKQFASVYDAKVRTSRQFLTIYARPNDLAHLRIGISISRKVGIAPKRNRIKRLLREAYRLTRHDLPSGYDLVVVVRPHDVAELAEYQQLLSSMAIKLHEQWRK